jgi:hypothetical protein
MDGRFYDHLKLIWNGKGVTARGPVDWDDEDASVSLYVAILQKRVTASGWTGNDLPHGADEFVVAASVDGDGVLEEGPATATGWAFVRGNEIAMYEWTVPVTLTERAAEAEPSEHEHGAGISEELKQRARTSK